ncbi:MAG: Gfo/Idh/MocA family oxidoreductase [Clostridia bacterium]|nr:Gfo/Idh/MocA family oxidoreductase [Clostridia bacterium]
MLKAAIIGFGGIAKGAHLPGYKTLEEMGKVKLVAACDICEEAFTKGAEINLASSDASDNEGIHTYTDLEEMLKSEKIDLIDICVPTYLHKKYAIDMLNRGYLVLSEKPMSLTSEDCKEMVAASNGRLMIGQCLRFSSEYIYAKKLVEEGTYGKPTSATFRRLSGPPTWGWDNWFMDAKRSGGVIFDLHIHDLDIARFIFGEPNKVSCIAGGQHIVEDAFAHSTLYYNDFTVFAEGRWDLVKMPFVADFSISFEKANIVCSGGQVTVYPYEGEKFCPELSSDSMYMKEIEYITDIFINGEENTQNPPESAAESIRLAETLKLSAQKNGEILKF